MSIADIFVDYFYGLSVSDLWVEAIVQTQLCLLDIDDLANAGELVHLKKEDKLV